MTSQAHSAGAATADADERFAQPALLRMPFDHYARYRLAAEFVEAVRPGAGAGAGAGARILDVGGGPGSLAAFVPRDRVLASDVVVPTTWHAAAPNLVVADGAALPFPAATFDAVVSLDTLEHVPPPHRQAVLTEVMRVARGWVLVVCPCATAGVAEADAALLELVRRQFGEDFSTVDVLEEHLGYGHPDPGMVERALRAAGADVARIPSGRIDRWLPMMVLFFHLLALGDDEPVERVQAWYNALFYRDDLRGPAYRQAFLCRTPSAPGPSLDAVARTLLPDGPPVSPDGLALQALQQTLVQDLARVSLRQRGELRRRDAEAQDLLRRLAVAEQRAEAAERAAAEAGQRVLALEAFRERLLSHPAMRARRAVRSILRRP